MSGVDLAGDVVQRRLAGKAALDVLYAIALDDGHRWGEAATDWTTTPVIMTTVPSPWRSPSRTS